MHLLKKNRVLVALPNSNHIVQGSAILPYQAHRDTFSPNFICGKNVGALLKEMLAGQKSPQTQGPLTVTRLILPYSSQILRAMYIYFNHSEPIIWCVNSFI